MTSTSSESHVMKNRVNMIIWSLLGTVNILSALLIIIPYYSYDFSLEYIERQGYGIPPERFDELNKFIQQLVYDNTIFYDFIILSSMIILVCMGWQTGCQTVKKAFPFLVAIVILMITYGFLFEKAEMIEGILG